jgi:thiamine biosynthesis lipoprotein
VSVPAAADTAVLIGQVEALFGRVERSCTRFDEASDLMRANADPTDAHEVAPECAAIVAAAHESYRVTKGLFDPRILSNLVAAGYDRTFTELATSTTSSAHLSHGTPIRSPWRPRIDSRRTAVTLGPTPIDLGGIGKGWAVDAAAALLGGAVPDFLVNAGGDLAVAGDGPGGDGWTVAVEDPCDPTLTLAVLRLGAGSCATSSTGRRRWLQDGAERHHLIDPRTGQPAAGGLQSVTVVADTTVDAETWSKALLIAGRDRVQELCRAHRLAAYWVTDDDRTGCSPALIPHLTWERRRGV